MELAKIGLTNKRIDSCLRLGLTDEKAILQYYPYRYEEYVVKHYRDFHDGEIVTFSGELLSYPSTFRYGKKSITRFNVLYEEEVLTVSIFNRPWIRASVGSDIVIIGKYENFNKITAINCYTKDLGEVLGIYPIYALKEGISQNDIRKIIAFVYKKCGADVADNLPSFLLKEHGLVDKKTAIRDIHFPQNSKDLKKAIARIKYEEFLNFYLSLAIMRGNKEEMHKKAKDIDDKKLEKLIDTLGYELTLDQKTAVNDIVNDLKSTRLMYRLLQGEVGCGKTAVAMIALYANYLAGYQGTIMAPTEILARQHYQSFMEVLNPLGVKIGLLYSADNNIKEIKKDIRDANYDIIIGTHALFSDDVEFKNLGLVITDEQQRFGVKQRQKLKDKGDRADFLMMSATPIPRTLATVIYGDMAISTIATLPKGRKGCKTYLIKENKIDSIVNKIKDELKRGQQVYIVASAIENNDSYHGKDVYSLKEEIARHLQPYRVGLLHGRMTSDEKSLNMEKFLQKEYDVLISTTVIEVGVNVKNATMMIVYDADRFGLSQLHQLRGRVQRGNMEGSCYLLTDSKDSDTLKRLQVLCDCNDGFKIAYEDLSIRGPGDILGTRQSGFVLGNVLEDERFIAAAKSDADKIMDNLEDEENRRLYQEVLSTLSL